MRSVAIVDPFEAGALYAPLLRARGFACQRVMSSPALAGKERLATLQPGDFDGVIDIRGGFESAVKVLRTLGVEAVLAGHEFGVLAADRLAAALGLPGNGVERSAARRDKAAMAALAHAAGLRVPEQTAGAAASPLLAWAEARGRWPVVAKPARGYGSRQVERWQEDSEEEVDHP